MVARPAIRPFFASSPASISVSSEKTQRKHAPDHLIFGDRFGFNTLDPDVMKEMLPYVDAIAIQPPFHGQFPQEKFDEIHQLTQKPILICDFAIRFKDGEKDIRSWKPAADSVTAGKAYAEYVQAALQTDYVIGVFWCNPVDTPEGFGKPGVKARVLRKRPGSTARPPSVRQRGKFLPRACNAKKMRTHLPPLRTEKRSGRVRIFPERTFRLIK